MSSSRPSWVVVSGAAGALGSALCMHYCAAGRLVLALDADSGGLAKLRPHANLRVVEVDLADADALRSALDSALEGRTPIALLANAVGAIWNEPILAFRDGRFVPHAVQSFERVLRANLTTAFVTASVVASRMARSGGGAIINFSSIAAAGNLGQVAYSSAKAGVEGMTRAMAAELGSLGVRVNAIAPGFIDAPTTRAALSESAIQEYARRTPLGRLGTIDELVAAVDSLASNTFLNGVVLAMDGGLKL